MPSIAPTDSLKNRALELGFQSVGVCDAVDAPHLDAYQRWLDAGHAGSMHYLARQKNLKKSPQQLLPGAKSVIAVALNYYQPVSARTGFPRVARYALGRDYHKVLRGKMRKLSSWITAEWPKAECRACVDSAPIFERDYANLAGLGFFGKNTMLIDPKRGSWFFIGLLLTTQRFQADEPLTGTCGTCTKCIEACPTGAIIREDGRWQLDARRCISYLTIEHRGPIETELQKDMGDWTFGCDVCQEVCPFNEPRARQPMRSSITLEPDFLRTRDLPSLRKLSSVGEPEWDQMTAGSPVRRTGLDGLKRNAQINLDNAKRSL